LTRAEWISAESILNSDTLLVASNMMMEWLLAGEPQFVPGCFRWIERLQAEPNLIASLQVLGLTRKDLVTALNVCPHVYTCSLLRGISCDLRSKTQVVIYTLTPIETWTAERRLNRALLKLHSVRHFLQELFAGQNDLYSVCECIDAIPNSVGSG
jgi:hypothetical protein